VRCSGAPPKVGSDPTASVREVLHPVGRLPARVYWRRRLIVLAVLVAVLAGGGWLVVRWLDPPGEGSTAAGGATTSRPVPTPALERVLPSLASVRTPETAPGTPLPEVRRKPAPSTAGPTPGGPCTDEMIELTMRAPTQVPVGSTPALEIVVRNVSEVDCIRRLDKDLQEVLLIDSGGDRVWGSNDCRPERSDVRRTLVPGEGVTLEIVWSGLSSEPDCAGERTTPAAGVYVLRGRLDTKTTPDRRIRLT
jgi:hypothetical protein